MFGLFKSNYSRAVAATSASITRLLTSLGHPPGTIFQDPYCLGFLQMVGLHEAGQTLKGSASRKVAEVLEDALKTIAPEHASDAAEMLSLIRFETSPDNAAYLQGNRDGDTFMRYRLHRVVSQRAGKAALERLSDRVRREHMTPRRASPPSAPAPSHGSPGAYPGGYRPFSPSSQPRPLQPPTTTQPERSEPASAQPRTVKTFVAAPSQWHVKRGETGIDGPRPKDEFTRAYEFSGLPPPDTTATVRIECTIESGGLRTGADGSSGLSLNRNVRFYLRPFCLPHEEDFVLRVASVDGSEGGGFGVRVSPVDAETAVISEFGGRNDTAMLLRTLMAGKDLTFEVLQNENSLVKVPLQNDGAFKQLWDESANRFAEIETVNEVLRPQVRPPAEPEDFDLLAEVRKNPKGYNVWMTEQEAGQYGVLIVKVDRDGRMEDAWQRGEIFPNQTAQGSYALELARELGVKLMDTKKRS